MQAVHDKAHFRTRAASLDPANAAPVAQGDSYWVPAGDSLSVVQPGVLGNDSDDGSGPLRAVLVAGPANGTLDLELLGGFSYTPATGFAGVDSFVYQASDGELASDPVTVEIRVERLELSGTAGSDRTLKGTEQAEIIRGGGGRLDQIWLNGGMDIVAFGDETHDGKVDITRIFDFDSDDKLDLGGATVAGYEKQGRWLVLTLDGDGDMIRLFKVEYADLVF